MNKFFYGLDEKVTQRYGKSTCHAVSSVVTKKKGDRKGHTFPGTLVQNRAGTSKTGWDCMEAVVNRQVPILPGHSAYPSRTKQLGPALLLPASRQPIASALLHQFGEHRLLVLICFPRWEDRQHLPGWLRSTWGNSSGHPVSSMGCLRYHQLG